LEVCATAVVTGSAIASFALQTSPANIIAARNAAACLRQLCLLLTAHTFVVGDAKMPKRRRSRIRIGWLTNGWNLRR